MGEAGSLELGNQLAGLSPRICTLFLDDVGQATPLLPAPVSLCIKKGRRKKGVFQGSLQISRTFIF